MKKQFFRVKQLADQTFLRAERSEVLNQEELHTADQRVEYLRSSISAIVKKIPPNTQGTDGEKRMKKTLEYQLSSIYAEDKTQNGFFPQVLREFCQVESDLAKDYAEHEVKVEEMVSAPLQIVFETEFPNITKFKKNLTKYCLDRDSASNRYQSTKKETVKEDMEEADIKVEQTRDSLALEMFQLLAKENDISAYILQLLKLQRGYHESALKNLERIIPNLEKKIGDSPAKPVFGIPLQEHLRVTGYRIAFPLAVCVKTLTDYGMLEEGLFRIGGSITKVKRLKASIDASCFSVLIPEYRDVHVLASVLKMYLRELPEPLLTYNLHKDWMLCMQYPEQDRLKVISSILAKLPQENRDNLAYLIQFLAKLTHYPENKMTSSNIAIVMSPNLLWNRNEEDNMNMNNCAMVNMLVELLIKEVNTFFPEDLSKLVNLPTMIPDEEIKQELNVSSESINILDSPRPNQRVPKKKHVAPVPPNHQKPDQIITNDKHNSGNHYPSGSSTLNRSQKPKSTVGVNTDENSLSLCRTSSFKEKEKIVNEPKVGNLVNTNDAITEKKSNVTQNSNSYITDELILLDDCKTMLKPPTGENMPKNEKHYKTTMTHQITVMKDDLNKQIRPTAAPRLINDNEKNAISRNSSLREYFNSEGIQLRKPENNNERMSNKPEVPARPASLLKRGSMDIDPTLQRNLCSVYSVAHKQQPSIVNIQNRNEKHQPGHDNQITEKEKFLGHQPEKIVPLPRSSLENKFNDVNSNCSNNGKTEEKNETINLEKSSEKLSQSKSNEKLNVIEKSNNQRPSHIRTRSDGNIIDFHIDHPDSLCKTPPSPRSLNKPTQPPPPPPVVSPTTKNKEDWASTDL